MLGGFCQHVHCCKLLPLTAAAGFVVAGFAIAKNYRVE
jgi:hypothetical protein